MQKQERNVANRSLLPTATVISKISLSHNI